MILRRIRTRRLKHAKIAIELLKQKGTSTDLFQVLISTTELYHESGKKNDAHATFSTIDTLNTSPQEKLQWYALGARIEYPGLTHQVLDKVFRENERNTKQYTKITVSEILYAHFKKIGNTEKSLYYKEVYSNCKDSILAKEKIVSTQRITLNRIVKEKNEAIATEEQRSRDLEHQFALEEERKTRWKYIIGFIIIILLSAIAFTYFLYRSNKQKLQLRQKELEDEKHRKSMLILRLDEARNAIKLKQQEIQSMREQEAADQTKPDSAEALMNNLNDRNWPNFLTEFELVYPGFFNRLDKFLESPLSKNERRLCCLIKLNLSNKEIAEYVFVSIESVKKAKNRLFKKFNLSDSDTSVSDKIRNL